MKSDIERAIEYFRIRKYFTAEELFIFWKEKDQDLNRNAFYQRFSRLKGQSTVKAVYADYYMFSDKPLFDPPKDYIILKIARKFKTEYPEINYCVWTTSWLHSFMIHQPTRSFIVFETEKDVIEQAFYLFKDLKCQTFFETEKHTFDYLILEEEEAIILKPLISRSPALFHGGIAIPALEKILVDIYSDTKQFSQYGGEELQNIYLNAYRMFHLNFNRLLYYAGRRGKRLEIMNQIKMFVDDSLIKILNDSK